MRFKRGPAFLPGLQSVQLHPERLDEPAKVKKPSRVFVCSMSDLFHEDVPDDYIRRVFYTIETSRHTYQVLTKRAERMKNFVRDYIWNHRVITRGGTPLKNSGWGCRSRTRG